MKKEDVCLIIGCSGAVYPSASVPEIAKQFFCFFLII
jgi:NAD-dependent SIR2 family protein deacetylase